jgi:hypothetical protein
MLVHLDSFQTSNFHRLGITEPLTLQQSFGRRNRGRDFLGGSRPGGPWSPSQPTEMQSNMINGSSPYTAIDLTSDGKSSPGLKRNKKYEPGMSLSSLKRVTPSSTSNTEREVSYGYSSAKRSLQSTQEPYAELPTPSKKAKKSKEPKEEKRARRFRPHAPQSFSDTYLRATTQRFYVLQRTREGTEECPEEVLELTGSTGNIYTVRIGLVPSCNCPQATKGNQCKHTVFVSFPTP